MIFVMLGLQTFHPESFLNKKSCLYTFLGFAQVLRNHIMWPNHMTILLFTLSIPLSDLT